MNETSELNQGLDSRDANQERRCWICLGTEQDDDDTDFVWIRPCLCEGSMKWVHKECLQQWIDEKQRTAISPTPLSCPFCMAQYILNSTSDNTQRLAKLKEFWFFALCVIAYTVESAYQGLDHMELWERWIESISRQRREYEREYRREQVRQALGPPSEYQRSVWLSAVDDLFILLRTGIVPGTRW